MYPSGFEIREHPDFDLLLPMRWRNLYPEKPLDRESSRKIDEDKGTLHFAAFVEDRIVGCVSLLREPAHECELRIRWLAVDSEWRGSGIGSELVRTCLQESRERGIWCNARISAVSLYERLSFVKMGGEFQIPEIGPHYLMRHKI